MKTNLITIQLSDTKHNEKANFVPRVILMTTDSTNYQMVKYDRIFLYTILGFLNHEYAIGSYSGNNFVKDSEINEIHTMKWIIDGSDVDEKRQPILNSSDLDERLLGKI